MENNIAMIPVICISERERMLGQLTVGEQYTLDRLTVWIDSDGDSYGTIYDKMGHRVGDLKLSHFRCR